MNKKRIPVDKSIKDLQEIYKFAEDLYNVGADNAVCLIMDKLKEKIRLKVKGLA